MSGGCENMTTWMKVCSVLAIVTLVGGCASEQGGDAGFRPLEGRDLVDLLDPAEQNRLGDPHVRAGLQALEGGAYEEAQRHFNRALKFDPTNSNLHFLNGLTYHLRAAAGDSSQTPYAAIGYRLALQYDAANYWAAYQLGHINFNDQNYRKAQDAFAYGLLFAPDEPALLKGLASASYYAQDLQTAYGAVDKLLQMAPDSAEVLRLASLVNAAADQPEVAARYLKHYRVVLDERDQVRADHVARRMADWRRLHVRSASVQLAQNIVGDDGTMAPVDDGIGDPNVLGAKSKIAGSTNAESSDRMVLVDVVIIRSEERRATNKGVNLLNGLTSTLSGKLFSFSDTRTINHGAANERATVFTYAPSLSIAAEYSLNIFNDDNERNEVLARPSLVALDGETSDFFTGAIFYVQITGDASTDATMLDVPVGIKLSVTPRFNADGTVRMEVAAARAFIEGKSLLVGFNNFAQVAKTQVTANVAMEFGDTLVISGLTEKETQNLKNGVPVLQSVPVLQYLFSNKSTLDYTKSVLVLLTPREPRYTFENGAAKVASDRLQDGQVSLPNLNELKARPGWSRPAPNLDAVFYHLRGSELYKEFRVGDVRLERWQDKDSLMRELKQAVEFLYY